MPVSLNYAGVTLSTKTNPGGQPVGNSQLWFQGEGLSNGKWIKVYDEDPRANPEAHVFWEGAIKVVGKKAVARLKYMPGSDGTGPGQKRGAVEGDIISIFVTLHPTQNDPAEAGPLPGSVIIDAPDA